MHANFKKIVALSIPYPKQSRCFGPIKRWVPNRGESLSSFGHHTHMLHGTVIYGKCLWVNIPVPWGILDMLPCIATFVPDEGRSEKLTKTKSWKANRILKKHWVETGFTHLFFRGETLNIRGGFS